VFNRFIAYRDKKVVGVFVRFRAPLWDCVWHCVVPPQTGELSYQRHNRAGIGDGASCIDRWETWWKDLCQLSLVCTVRPGVAVLGGEVAFSGGRVKWAWNAEQVRPGFAVLSPSILSTSLRIPQSVVDVFTKLAESCRLCRHR
jgi:hypothetical protein